MAQQSHPADAANTDSVSGKEIALSSALVVGQRAQKVQQPLMGVAFLRPEHIKSIPTMFGEADIVKALQMQPGVSSGVDGFAGMMVRGGNNDQNLFLIDGNPIYQMNHAGGLFSAYNIEAIRDVAFFKSAFPARYGGRLSSVVDITTKTGHFEKYHGAFSIGLTSANLSFGGPIVKERTTFNIALRRSWLDVLTAPAIAIANSSTKSDGEKIRGNYVFTDLNLQLHHRFQNAGTLSFIGYFGQDRLTSGGDTWSTNNAKPENYWRDNFEGHLKWGNLLGALKWQMPINDQLLHSLTLAYTRYNSRFGFADEQINGEKGTPSYSHHRSTKDVTNGIDDLSLRSQWLWTPLWHTQLRFGADYVLHRFTPEKNRETSTSDVQLVKNEKNFYAHESALYADAEMRPLEWLNFNAGMRLSDFVVKGTNYLQLEPRASVNFILTPSVSLKGSYARMTQFVQQVSETYISMPTDYWMPVTDKHAPLNSDQFSIGAYYSYHNRWNVSLEGWYKKMNHLLEYKEGHGVMARSISWADKLTSGRGTAYGIDLQVEKNFGRIAGFVGYGLLWTERRFAQLNRGRAFPSKYDNRHKFNIALSYRASRRFEMNASWTVMTGNLITLAWEDYDYAGGIADGRPPYPSTRENPHLAYINEKNNFRLPAYHRLDVGFNIHRFHKKGQRSIWNFSVYNAYAHHNSIMVRKKIRETEVVLPDGSTRTVSSLRFQSISLFPIVPSVSYTYKF